MTQRRAAFILLFVIPAIAGLVLAFVLLRSTGGDSSKPNATERTRFEQRLSSLRTELDNIGPNIDVVPPDVLRSIIGRCHDLEQYADKNKVSPLCDAIQRAHDNKDTALIDQVVAQLDQLEPK